MIYTTAYVSLVVQILVAIIDIFGLTVKVPENKNLFRDLLKLELGVQVVEMIFYVWLIINFALIQNITPHRYYDWILTTPTMLITLMAFLDQKHYSGIVDFLKQNTSDIIKVISANMLMLLFGLMGELGYIQYQLAIVLGFVPFLYYYHSIYKKYIDDKKELPVEQKGLFWFFFVVWSLYGVAAFFPYVLKNSAYNILDLFAKNFTGLFLVYIIWKNRVQTPE
jgi:bacteriorhodopsin